MTKENFKHKFIELVKILFSMPNVGISISTPNGEIIDVYARKDYCLLTCHHMCHRGSMEVYRFYNTRKNGADNSAERMDHIGFLTSYLYYENKDDMDRQKIIDSLKIEIVKQI